MVQFVREFNACGLSSYSAPGIRLGFLDTKVGKKKKKKRETVSTPTELAGQWGKQTPE